MRRLLPLPVLVVCCLALPVAARASVDVEYLPGDDSRSDLVSFSSASCKKSTAKKPILHFIATAKKDGYTLRVNYYKKLARTRTLTYGSRGGVDVTLEGPVGEFSNLNRPPNSPPGGGAISFNGSRSRMGLGFSPMFDEGASSAVTLGGGLTCHYPKPKKKKRKR